MIMSLLLLHKKMSVLLTLLHVRWFVQALLGLEELEAVALADTEGAGESD